MTRGLQPLFPDWDSGILTQLDEATKVYLLLDRVLNSAVQSIAIPNESKKEGFPTMYPSATRRGNTAGTTAGQSK